MCRRENGKVRFYTAHGFATGKEAITAAKAKAGGGSLCSRALWSVPQPASPQPGGVIDAAKGAVHKAVACKENDPSLIKLPPGTGEQSKATPKCPDMNTSTSEFAIPCACVRG